MKKLIVIVAISSGLLFASCGNQSGSTNQSGTDNSNATDNVVNDSNKTGNQTGNAPMANDSFANSSPSGSASTGTGASRGSSLIAARDCKTCHTVNQKNIGPSFQMIADKYGNSEAMADELSLKIIKGGSGRWGKVVMPPHQDISTEDARDMARYILSLSTKR